MFTLSGCDIGWNRKKSWQRHPTLKENVVVGAGAKFLDQSQLDLIHIGAGSVVVRNVEGNSTVVGVPGRVVHQSGVMVNPCLLCQMLKLMSLNLMDRIDQLENEILKLQKALQCLATLNLLIFLNLATHKILKTKKL